MSKKEKPWTWCALPPGCPLYASVEDVENKTPTRDIKDGDEVITFVYPGCYAKFTITEKNNKFWGEGGDLVFEAVFSEEQNCWVQYTATYESN